RPGRVIQLCVDVNPQALHRARSGLGQFPFPSPRNPRIGQDANTNWAETPLLQSLLEWYKSAVRQRQRARKGEYLAERNPNTSNVVRCHYISRQRDSRILLRDK